MPPNTRWLPELHRLCWHGHSSDVRIFAVCRIWLSWSWQHAAQVHPSRRSRCPAEGAWQRESLCVSFCSSALSTSCLKYMDYCPCPARGLSGPLLPFIACFFPILPSPPGPLLPAVLLWLDLRGVKFGLWSCVCRCLIPSTF